MIAAILLAGLAAYSGSFRGVFIFDDKAFLDEPAAQNLWPLGRILATPRPVVEFTLALNYALGGPGEWGYHAFNLAIHLLAALALFGIVRRTLILPSLAPRFGRASTALAFCVALLWALHPLQTESVTYIIQRMESLMGLFYLLTLYCFIRAAASSNHPDAKTPGTNQLAIGNWQLPIGPWYVAAVAACALGMGSKEVMVTAPVLVLLYDRTFIAGSFRDALRRRWGFYLALAATWAVLARQIIEAFAPGGTSAGFGIPALTPFQYARSELGVILHYLKLAFWPSGLCLYYGWPVAQKAADILPGAIVVGGLLAVTVWANVAQAPSPARNSQPGAAASMNAPMFCRPLMAAETFKKDGAAAPGAAVPHFRRAWGFLGAWFFLILAPTSSIMPIWDLAFEHRMYLSLAAVVAAVVLAAYRVVQERPIRGPVIAPFAMFAAAATLGFLTFSRNQDYQSNVRIWQDTVNKRPDNPRAWNNLGEAFCTEGNPAAGIEACDRAIAKLERYPEAYYNRGNARADLNQLDLALADFSRAIELRPDFTAARNNRANVYIRMGRFRDALQDYDEAIRLRPDFVLAWYNRGMAYERVGRDDLALSDYNQAIELKPNYADAYNNRAGAYARMGRDEDALRDFDKAIRYKQDFAEAYNNRGNLRFGRAVAPLLHFQNTVQAIEDYDKAIALKADYAEAYYNRGNAWFSMNRRDRALSDYSRAIELDPNEADAYGNRAAVYYQMKAYDKALADVRVCQKLGGRPAPAFLKALNDAAGRAE